MSSAHAARWTAGVPGRLRRRTRWAALALGWAVGAAAQTLVAPGALGIGMAAPLSGPGAALGLEVRTGLQACIDQTNAEGGVAGHRLALVALDDGGVPERTAAHTRTLAADPRVVLLGGYVGLDTTQAALPLLSPARLPLVGVLSGAEALRTPEQRQLFHLRAGYRDEVAAIVWQLDTMGVQRISLLYQDDAMGRDGLAAAQSEISKYTITPASTGAIRPDGADAERAAREVGSGVPSAVILITGPRAAGAFVQAMARLQQQPRYIALSDAGGEPLVRALGPLSRGIGLSQVLPSPSAQSRQLVRDYRRAMHAAGHESVSYASLEGCMVARVAAEALRRAGREPTRERVQQALESGGFDLGGYRLRFSAAERRGSAFTEMTVVGADGRITR